MKIQYRYFKQSTGIYSLVEKSTGKRKSLRTCDEAEAQKLTQAYNDAVNQAAFNLALAKVYLVGADPKFTTRTWQDVMEDIVERKSGDTARQERRGRCSVTGRLGKPIEATKAAATSKRTAEPLASSPAATHRGRRRNRRAPIRLGCRIASAGAWFR